MPINRAKQQLQGGANLEQGFLGVSVGQTTTTGESGVTIESIEPGSGAVQAGLQQGDVITAIGGAAVTDYGQRIARISGKQPDTKAQVAMRRNGAEQQIAVTVQARSTQPTP